MNSLIFYLNYSEKKLVRNQNFIFVTFCLIVAMGMLQLRHVLEATYGDERSLRDNLRRAEVSIEKEKMRTILYQNQLLDMQTQVASLDLSSKVRGVDWVQSLRVPASIKKIDLSSMAFEEASQAFNGSNYQQSVKLFQQLLEKYPVAPKAVEARFLLAESYFRLNKLPECLDQIDEMINHYPESKLTGYVMLRMGQIFKVKNQNEKMTEVFRMVIRNFPQEKALVAQAQELLRKSEK